LKKKLIPGEQLGIVTIPQNNNASGRHNWYMEFDWTLFLGISIIGPYFGRKMCAAIEKKVTGEVRMGTEFRKKRMKSTLISIAVSYVATQQIIGLIDKNVSQGLDLLMRVLSVVIGVSIYLLLQRVIYRISLRNF